MNEPAMDYGQLVVPGDGCAQYQALASARWGTPLDEPDLPVLLGDCRIEAMPIKIGDAFQPESVDHPNIAAARDLFEHWPEAQAGFGALVSRFWPLGLVDEPDKRARGSCSGHQITEDGHRAAYVTVYDPIGCWEGLLHEWGHLRLWTLGVELETHDGGLLEHDDEERFVSPIRRDKLRPMSAVLHGVYCWVLMNDGRQRLFGKVNDAQLPGCLAWDLPKIEEGIITISEHARWTESGEAFGDALLEYAARVVANGWDLLGESAREPALQSSRKWIESQPVAASPLHGLELTGEEPR